MEVLLNIWEFRHADSTCDFWIVTNTDTYRMSPQCPIREARPTTARRVQAAGIRQFIGQPIAEYRSDGKDIVVGLTDDSRIAFGKLPTVINGEPVLLDGFIAQTPSEAEDWDDEYRAMPIVSPRS